MAFNPFTNFRKYQKIWMATILLLCMITFVLCTGTQGDFMELVLRNVRSKGTVTAKIDGDNLYSSELYDLRTRRNIANEFMNKAKGHVLQHLDEFLKPESQKKLESQIPNANEREAKMMFAAQLRQVMEQQYSKRPRFFGTGVKLDDLIDHKLWLMEADRLRIDFTEDAVTMLVSQDFGGQEWFGARVFNDTLVEVRYNNQTANRKNVILALKDEYRVRAAQKALAEAQLHLGNKVVSTRARVALTPGQMWEYYQEKRVEYNVALLPLYVEDFTKKVRQPTDVELSTFFDANKHNPYNPMSDKVGFEIPYRIKVSWVSADPSSDFYKRASKLAIDLQTTLSPLGAGALAPLQVASSAAAKSAAAQQQFDAMRSKYRSASLIEAGADLAVVDWLLRHNKDAMSAATLVGAALRLDGGIAALPARYAYGLARHGKAFQAGVKEELKTRAPVYATLALMGASHAGQAIPGTWYAIEFQPRHLPMSLVQDELFEGIERNVARDWVQKNMQIVKRKLEEPNITTALAVKRVLDPYVQSMGLDWKETKDLYHRYNINDAKELEPLYKSFVSYLDPINNIEGRTLPEKKLKDSDFWKMFFDSQESFSIASAGRYQPKPWPPETTIASQLVQQARVHGNVPQFEEIARIVDATEPGKQPKLSLFKDAERPFLFWQTAAEPPVLPDKLDPVRDRVVEAWKFNKAREDEVLPRAKKLADKIMKGTPPYRLVLNEAIDELKKDADVKREIIPLPKVSPLQPVSSGFGRGRVYAEYQVPPGLIPFPREDTAKLLLELYDLKKPIETGNKQLDEINKALYNEVAKDKKPQGKYVQVLTNKTRSAYFIAVVRDEPYVSQVDFRIATHEAFGQDELYATAQFEAAKAFREDLNQHLRRHYEVEIVDEEAHKNFDSDVSS